MWAKIGREPALPVVFFGVFSVLLGLLRERAVASQLGVSSATDAFYLASALLLFFPSLVNGASQGILAPQFARAMLRSGPTEAKRHLEQLLFIVLGLGAAAAVVGLLGQGIASFLYGTEMSERTKLTMTAAAWLAFTVPSLCFATTGVTALNVLGRYWLGAASTCLAPLVATLSLYMFEPSMTTFAGGVVLGLGLQTAIVALALARDGVILTRRPPWSAARVLLKDMSVVGTGVVAAASTPLVIQAVVAGLGDNALTHYTLGTKITTGFIGMTALILSSILTPMISARASGLPYSRMRLRIYLWLTAVVCLGSTLVLTLWPESVVQFFLGRALAPPEMAHVARVQFYAALQIPAFILLFLGMRAVQAYHAVKFVTAMNWVQAALTLALGLALHAHLGLVGILAAGALSYTTCGVCYLLKYRQLDRRAKRARAPVLRPAAALR